MCTWTRGARLLTRRVLDGELPALVVLAWREEDADEAARTELDLLSRHPAAEVLPLHPLGVRHGARLLDGLLALSPDLAESLARRSRGSPLFSLEVARDLVRIGLLEPGPRGYQLRAGATALPQSLAEVWRQRLSPLLHHREDRVAFELAALLDDPVQPAVLASACRALGVPEPLETWQLLLREGLVRPLSDGAWRFSHALLRRSLAEDCRASGRWGEAHAACAAAMREHPEAPGHLLALHLAHAGEHDEALALLPPATEAAIYAGDRSRALQLSEATARCLRSLGRAHDRDRSWLELRLRRARVARIGEETATARAEAQAVLDAATALDAERLIIAASRVVVQGDIDLGHFEEAAALAGRHAARSPLLLGYRAMALGRLGRLDVAEAIAAELVPHTAFLAAFLMGVFALERDEPELARARLEDAISRAEAADSTLNAASFRTELAVALRSSGDPAGALDVAQEAASVLDAVGSPWVAGAQAQVGLAALALGRHEVARRALLQVRKLTRERPDEGARHLALAGLARLGARLDDYDLVKEALAAPLPVLPLTRAASRDVVALWRATMGSLSSPSQAALCGLARGRLEALLRS